MPPAGGKAAVVVLWELRDPAGKLLGERGGAGRGRRPAIGSRGSDDAVARLAAASAEQIAAMLLSKAPVAGGGGRSGGAPGC